VRGARGGRKNKEGKRRASAPAHKKKYARALLFLFYLLGFISRVVLGVPQQGELKKLDRR
jgi:hypothetical protein